MSEMNENALDPFALDSPIETPKEEIRKDPLANLLELPKNQGRFSQTSQAILEELRVRHRRLEMHGSAEIAPSLLFTLDKISEVLVKEVHLPENHKTVAAVSESLSELSDFPNQFKNRSVYFYPFLLRIDNGISIRIAMVAPQNKDKIDIVPFRRACFKYSEEILLILFKNLSKQDPILDEIKPGKILLSRDENGNLVFSPNVFSFETDVRLITDKGFLPYSSFVIPDFIEDVVKFGVDNQLLFEVNPQYHLVITQYGYVEVLLKNVAVQLDGLVTYAFQHLKKIAKDFEHFVFIDTIEDLESRMPDSRNAVLEGGWKIAYELIKMIHEFPFEEQTSNHNLELKAKCFESASNLEKLLAEIQKKGRDIHEEKFSDILRKVKEKVMENTKKNLLLTPVDIELEMNPLFAVSKEERSKLISRFLDELGNSIGIYPLKDNTGKLICYSVDQRYLRDVVEKTKEISAKESRYLTQLPYLESIRKVLITRNDSQLDLLSESPILDPELNSKDSDDDNQKKSKLDLEEIQSTFHLPTLLITTLSGSVIATIVSLFTNDLEMLVGGVFASVVAGVVLGYFSKQMEPSKVEKNPPKKFGPSVTTEHMYSLVRAAETVLFPKKFNNIFDKVYDIKKLRYTIEEQVEEIRNLLPPNEKKKDTSKLIAEIEAAIPQLTISLKVPENIQMKGRSREFIFGRSDFKTLVFRDKLAEHFRKESSVYKNDPDMLTYLNFLIREIELGYTKYLKS